MPIRCKSFLGADNNNNIVENYDTRALLLFHRGECEHKRFYRDWPREFEIQNFVCPRVNRNLDVLSASAPKFAYQLLKPRNLFVVKPGRNMKAYQGNQTNHTPPKPGKYASLVLYCAYVEVESYQGLTNIEEHKSYYIKPTTLRPPPFGNVKCDTNDIEKENKKAELSLYFQF